MNTLKWVSVATSAGNVTMFRYTNMVRSLLGGYENVNQVADFWNFLENDLMDALYWEEWYNTGDDWKNQPCPVEGDGPAYKGGPCPITEDERMVMYSNKLLGQSLQICKWSHTRF